MPEDNHTPKTGKLSLSPLKFEDALRGLLTTKSPEKKAARKCEDTSKREKDESWR